MSSYNLTELTAEANRLLGIINSTIGQTRKAAEAKLKDVFTMIEVNMGAHVS